MARNNKKEEHTFKIGEKVKYGDSDVFIIGKPRNVRGKSQVSITNNLDDFFSDNPVTTEVPCGKLTKYKTYSVDVHWDVARSFEIEATSREEAVRLMESRIANGNVCVWNDGFEATDDVECECNGEENEDGEIEFD